MNVFAEMLSRGQLDKKTNLCLSLDIQIPDTPLPLLSADEPMLPFGRAIIEATRDLVCAYQIRPIFFLAEGGSGLAALERLVRLIPADIPIILDLRVDDVSLIGPTARTAFYQLQGRAVTARPGLPREAARALANFDQGGHAVIAHFDQAPLALPDFFAGYSIAADESSLAPAARGLNPRAIALLQRADQLDPSAAGPLAAENTFFVVDRSVLYASKRMTFADDARAAALELRARFTRPHTG